MPFKAQGLGHSDPLQARLEEASRALAARYRVPLNPFCIRWACLFAASVAMAASEEYTSNGDTKAAAKPRPQVPSNLP